jgi:fructose-1,6-bisphosphatase I
MQFFEPKKMNDAAKRIEPFLRDKGVSDNLRNVIFSIAHAGKYVAHAIRHESTGYSESANASGEDQLKLDVLSDKIFCDHLQTTVNVANFASEEQDNEVHLECDETEKYSVAFDPLDGSSLVSSNLAIGSIFGIYKGEKFLGQKGRDMAAAGYIIYGPRTVCVVATEQGVWEFKENGLGEFVISRENITVKEDAKYFAPGNLRATSERKDYMEYVQSCMTRKLTLRYSGGMVPDIHMILSKGSGIFSYPSYSDAPNGKLRLLYECAPFAYIMEKAGGIALDENGKNILDKEVEELHERTPIFIGSKNEVEKAVGMLEE